MNVSQVSNGGSVGRNAAAPIAASRMSRLSAWIGGVPGPHPTNDPPEAGAGRAVHRELFARIGDFLDRHALEPSVAHFDIVRSYLLRDDHRLASVIDGRLRDGDAIDASFLQLLTASCQPIDPLSPDRIAAMADALAARLAETETTVRQSHASARDYEQALSMEARTAGSDPGGTVTRLLALTGQAIARNRQLADRLEETRLETGRLRSNLQDARRAADEDHLTGLPNRRCFDGRLHDVAATGAAGAHCVALCDIDDFKAINDRHGHDAGDRVLKLVARHLTTELGASVLVARHGGEEFACLFEDCAPDAALALLDHARETLAARNLVNQATGEGIGRITLSGGLAILGEDTAAAMRAADAALYAAKRTGKNRMVFTAPDEA